MAFLPGRELCERFYREAVAPVLARHFPALPYAAARLDGGSEVLGFDTPMSMDHDWGPRLQLFVGHEDLAQADAVGEALRRELPAAFLGFPTGFVVAEGDTSLVLDESGAANHRVTVESPRAFFLETLGYDIDIDLSPADWLTIPEQKLLVASTGPIYHDSIGLETLRSRFSYYPHDVWLYQMASVWTRIGQEEHLVGRAGFVGDELGAKLIAARLVRDLMRLAFLQERQYAPYPKWFGTAFARLPIADKLSPLLEQVLRADGWEARDAALAPAYRMVAQSHNQLAITESGPDEPAPFFGRPFSVIELHSGFAAALLAKIEDPEVRAIASKRPIGGIDVFSDSTDLVSDAMWRPHLVDLFNAAHPLPQT